MKALAAGKPEIFKCYAKIMSFALPFHALQEKAVILGQGSYASYEDFRESMDLMSSSGLDTTIPTTLSFTSTQDAMRACDFISEFIPRLLKNSREALLMRRKFGNLKQVLGTWQNISEESPEAFLQDLMNKLAELLDIENLAILPFDPEQSSYISRHNLAKGSTPPEAIRIHAHDALVQDLLKNDWVLSAEPVQDPTADFLNGMGALYFFPIRVNQKLAAIVRICDMVLMEDEKHIISLFCRQAGLSQERCQRHQELQVKFNRLASVPELTKTLAPIQDQTAMLHAILEKSATLAAASRGSVMLLDHETNCLRIKATRGTMHEAATEQLKIQRGTGIAGKVAETGEPLVIEDIERDPRIRQTRRSHYKTASCISLPLKVGDRILGVVNLADKENGEPFQAEDLKIIQSFTTHAAITMERNACFNTLQDMKKLAVTDPLTGLFNRRYLLEQLQNELARCKRHGHVFSLCMLDLDEFKYCNDTFGHLFGDTILQRIAQLLLQNIRSTDVLARIGGDEFLVLLPETPQDMARELAERLRTSVEQTTVLPFDALHPRPLNLTASLGIVCYPDHGDTSELLLEHVDKALYRAKKMGKNVIEVHA